MREWLINQAAGGYAEYDPATGEYSLTPEQAVSLTDDLSPFFVGGGFFVVKAMTQAVERIEDHFRNGGRNASGRASSGLVYWDRTILQARLCGTPRCDVDPISYGH